jgi:hypothetical protein
MSLVQVAMLGAFLYAVHKHYQKKMKPEPHPMIPRSTDFITQDQTRLMGMAMFEKSKAAQEALRLHSDNNVFVPYGSNA